jgi:hypothetical protein
MDVLAELEIVRLDRIERRAREYFESAARHSNVHRMLRAARLEAAAHAKSLSRLRCGPSTASTNGRVLACTRKVGPLSGCCWMP